MQYSISQCIHILQAQSYQFSEDPTSTFIHYIYTDTRIIFETEGACFLALKSEQNDGHHYITMALSKGIRNFIINENYTAVEFPKDTTIIRVKDTWHALHLLAQHHREQSNALTIGITGSNGKTITKEFLFHLLEKDYKVARSPKSYNSQLGVPLSLLTLEPFHNLAIWEAGISKKGEMEVLERIIQPHWGIFTTIGSAHAQYFESRFEKITEKLKLFQHSTHIFYCKDHIHIDQAILNDPTYAQKIGITWGFHEASTFKISSLESKNHHTYIHGTYEQQTYTFCLNFIDKAYVDDALHAILVLLYKGYSEEHIQERLGLLSPVGMRLEVKKGIKDSILINDVYSLDMTSLRAGLDFLIQQPKQYHTVILSDFLELGKSYEDVFITVAQLLKERKIHQVLGIGPEIFKYQHCFKGLHYSCFESVESFLQALPQLQLSHQNILIKGARAFHFEQILNVLEAKKAETYLEINLGALLHNYRYLKSLLHPSTKTMAMVKAFSYGIGSIEMAHLLQYHHVDYFGVAFIDEGITLRQNHITTPIMVMNTDLNHMDRVLEYHLEPEIYSFRSLKAYINSLNKLALTEGRVHIKLDTGMHRLGFVEDDLEELIEVLCRYQSIKVMSIFSHLSSSDDLSHHAFTTEQIELFKQLSSRLETALGYKPLKHILNSQGILNYTEAQFDMVRLGIGLYGIGDRHLEPVTGLYTHISQLKQYTHETSIGYSRKGWAHAGSTIATLPIGYADGLRRSFGNGVGHVLIQGQKAPFVGNICMDMCMVDVTGIPCEEGDEVVIFNHRYKITELADQIQTIPYELLTSISPRVSRVYIE